MSGSPVRERPAPARRSEPELAIDPRILSRLVAVRKDQYRRRRRATTVILGVVTLVILGWLALRSPVLALRHVDVVGATHTGSPAVVAAAGLGRGRPLLDVNGAAVQRRVLALPWIARVVVARRWPSTVRIRIVERTPLAQVAGPGGQPAVVDQQGRVLAVGPGFAGMTAASVAALPWLVGARPVGPAGATVDRGAVAALSVLPTFLAVVAGGAPASAAGGAAGSAGGGTAGAAGGAAGGAPAGAAGGARQVSSVMAAPDGSLRVVISPGPVIVLVGTSDALAAKVQAVRPLLAQVPAGVAATIDVRVPDAPVLTGEQIGTIVSTTQRG